METQVTERISLPIFNAALTTGLPGRGGLPARVVGIRAGSRIGSPISTRTRRTRSVGDLEFQVQDAPAGFDP